MDQHADEWCDHQSRHNDHYDEPAPARLLNFPSHFIQAFNIVGGRIFRHYV